mgnify:CR=1 FL=1
MNNKKFYLQSRTNDVQGHFDESLNIYEALKKEFKSNQDTQSLSKLDEDYTYFLLQYFLYIQCNENPDVTQQSNNFSSLIKKNVKVNEFKKYMSFIAPKQYEMECVVDTTCCSLCGGDIIFEEKESCETCLECGDTRYILSCGVDNLSYEQSINLNPPIKVTHAYKRQTHFNDLLNRIQSNTNTKIPDHVLTMEIGRAHV